MLRGIIYRVKVRAAYVSMKREEDLLRERPEYHAWAGFTEIYKQQLANHYASYISTVSSAEMAASLSLAGSLLGLCRVVGAGRALDLGSGFTSFALRQYKHEGQHLAVCSVDDDAAWLERTREYLAAQGVSRDHVEFLPDFVRRGTEPFDVTLLDLNFVEVRRHYIEMALEVTRPGGVVIFDDVHKEGFLVDVVRHLRRRRLRYYLLDTMTRDSLGRFSLLAFR